MPPSRHSNHAVSHYPHPSSRDLHHGGPPPMSQAAASGPHHPHSSSYSHSMGPPPGLPPHAMNGSMAGPPPNGPPLPPPPPGRMMMMDGPGGAPGAPPHIPRSSSAQSHLMDAGGPPPGSSPALHKLALANEAAWVSIGSTAEAMEDYERALAAYETALRHNPYSVPALSAIAGVHRALDNFEKAVAFFQRVLDIVPENGDTWGSMGHCYLMMDDLQRAYTAYQQALYHLPNPKEPKLWYGIGILYDRYGSLEHAEEAFASVVRMDPNYEKANEIYFRLGIIYKQQNKFPASLECFRYILNNPPRPLTEIDIWFQIGHVYEQQKEFNAAKEAYERVLAENPNHAKVLQQLGWLYHLSNAGFNNQERAIQFLTKSLEADPNDSQSWYLLGRAYMAGQNYNKAYEAYQQAVYRDGKNPTFWCSIGVLYYQINQYRDALDAYSRAIRLNPYISEVWFDLGSLYEACNNQIGDAIHAYERAADLDPNNPQIQQRLVLLRNVEAKGTEPPEAPVPQDVHPTAYANNNGMAPGPPTQLGGGPSSYTPSSISGPQLAGTSGPRGGEMIDRDLPGPGHLSRASSPPFRGGGPPSMDGRRSRGPNPGAMVPTTGGPDSHYREGGYADSRGPSPAPRMDPYGRRLGSPPRRTPPPLRRDVHEVHGHDYHGPQAGLSGPLVDQYGRPAGGPMNDFVSERDRDLEWERERERAARGYAGGGRVTPKNEASYSRSQQGSNGPSPAFSRPAVYDRDDGREYYGRGIGGPGGYEQAPPSGRYDERGPPPESERDHVQQRNARYEGYADTPESNTRAPRPVTAPRGPIPDVEKTRVLEQQPQRPMDGTDSRGAGTPNANLSTSNAPAKSRRAPKSKEELDNTGTALSPVLSANAKKTKGSRASSPWSAKGTSATGKTTARADGKGTASGNSGKKTASKLPKTMGDGSPTTGSASAQQRETSPASSDGSNEPLAARAPPSRVVDEDYDEGAADALMGLAGAASASAPQPAADRAETPEKRGDSLLGKRPLSEEMAASANEETFKRSKNDVALDEAAASANSGDKPEMQDAPSTVASQGNGDHNALNADVIDGGKTASEDAPEQQAAKDTNGTNEDVVTSPKVASGSTSDLMEVDTAAAPKGETIGITADKEGAVPAVTAEQPNKEDSSKEEEEGQIHEDEGDSSMKGPDDTSAPASSGATKSTAIEEKSAEPTTA